MKLRPRLKGESRAFPPLETSMILPPPQATGNTKIKFVLNDLLLAAFPNTPATDDVTTALESASAPLAERKEGDGYHVCYRNDLRLRDMFTSRERIKRPGPLL